MGGGVEEGGSRQPRCWGRGYFVLDIRWTLDTDTGLLWHQRSCVCKVTWDMGQCLSPSVLTCYIIPSPYLVRMSARVVCPISLSVLVTPVRTGHPAALWHSGEQSAVPAAASHLQSSAGRAEGRLRLVSSADCVECEKWHLESLGWDNISSSLI